MKKIINLVNRLNYKIGENMYYLYGGAVVAIVSLLALQAMSLSVATSFILAPIVAVFYGLYSNAKRKKVTILEVLHSKKYFDRDIFIVYITGVIWLLFMIFLII